MSFERKLEKPKIDELIKSSLWKNCLKQDCLSQKVFLAIRNNTIGFYHKGGKLFGFEKNEFKTHVKYASIIEDSDKDYLTEKELSTKVLISNFQGNYHRIKENCELYSGIEAKGVSEIYHKYSYISNNDVVVLDIEASFESLTNDKQDRIDIVLYDKKSQTLKFVEAKHFSNSEIWSTTTPKVVKQVKKYEAQIKKNKNEIIKAYTNYIEAINNIFSLKLPTPLNVEENVSLLIFGFDANQKQGRLQELVLKNPAFKGFQVYAKQNGINPKTLWNTNHLNYA